jgi:hypothetical protein
VVVCEWTGVKTNRIALIRLYFARWKGFWQAKMRFLTLFVAIWALVGCHAFTIRPEATRRQGRTTAVCAAAAASSSSSSSSNNNDAPPLRRNPPRNICLMVEPTPFTHVSGYANRFKEMLKFMRKAGDNVEILTVDAHTHPKKLPKKSFGYNIQHTLGFTFPLYNHISLTIDLPEMKGAQIIEKSKPDLIHVTSP